MANIAFTYTFKPDASGAYDPNGTYFGPSVAEATYYSGYGSNGSYEIPYYALNATTIQAQIDRLTAQGASFTGVQIMFTTSSLFGSGTTSMEVYAGYYASLKPGDFNYSYGSNYPETSITVDKTDRTGESDFASVSAFNFMYLQGAKETQEFDKTFKVTYNGLNDDAVHSYDVTKLVFDAARSGHQIIIAAKGDEDFLSDVSIVVTGVTQSGNPVVSNTVPGQQVQQRHTISPFTTVTLSDPGNPGGSGDDVYINILDSDGNATDAYGTLSSPVSDGFSKVEVGTYEVGPFSSLSTLQSRLRGLVFTAKALPAGQSHHALVLDLDIQSGAGGSGDNETTTLDVSVACYCRGTLILTTAGEVPVECLSAGMRVVTAAGEARPIVWIGQRSYAGRMLTGRRHLLPVGILAGALGGGLPRRDLFVSPQHAMFLDGVLVPAVALVNGRSIVQDMRCDRVDYFHVELERHDVILAEGAPSETFLDDGSRGMFHNAATFVIPRGHAPSGFCAPRVDSGWALERVRRSLPGTPVRCAA